MNEAETIAWYRSRTDTRGWASKTDNQIAAITKTLAWKMRWAQTTGYYFVASTAEGVCRVFGPSTEYGIVKSMLYYLKEYYNISLTESEIAEIKRVKFYESGGFVWQVVYSEAIVEEPL